MRPAWEPTERYLERSRLRRFAERNGHRDYASLLRWSTDALEAFWRATERELAIQWRVPYSEAVDQSRGMPWTTWWTGGRMNYVAPVLRHDPGRVAVIAEAEEGDVRTLTYGQLATQTAHIAAGLRKLGVERGDRVAVFLPLTVECVVAVLAIGAIGAIFIPVFSGYGAEAIAGRLRDADAKVLICADGFYRRGQVVAMKETADAAADAAPSVKDVVVVRRLDREVSCKARDSWWEQIASEGETSSLGLAHTRAEGPCDQRIGPRSSCSARPASRGTPTHGGGISGTSASRDARSSITPAAPRSPAGSSGARPGHRFNRARSPAHARGWRRMSSTSTAGRCAARSASLSSANPGQG